MKIYLHKGPKVDDRAIKPMTIFGDTTYVIDYLWNDEEVKGFIKDFLIIDKDCCYLDAGGCLYTKDPGAEFEIDGNKFYVPLTKIEGVLSYLEKKDESCVPGYVRCNVWQANCCWNLIMPKQVYTKLIAKLKELQQSDEVLHIELDFSEALEQVNKSKHCHVKYPRRG